MTNVVDLVVPSAVAYGYYDLRPEKALVIGAGYLAGRMAGTFLAVKSLAGYEVALGLAAAASTALPTQNNFARYYPAAGGVAGAALAGAMIDGISYVEGAVCGAAGALVCMAMNKM